MLISIVVPVYKVEAYIHTCVDSLLNQTHRNVEIILVDDGSPDNCPKICDEYAERDGRVKVVHKENGGLSDARNAGLRVATGEYVLFVDSDDHIELDTCERFLPFAQKGYDILIGDALVEGGNCDLRHIDADGRVFDGLEYFKKAVTAGRAPMAVCLNLFRREFLLKNQLEFKVGILHEDEQFSPRALLAAGSVIVTGVSFYHYIIRDGSITTQKDKRKNATDFYGTCCELELLYQKVADRELRELLLDSLAAKYLSLFYSGGLHKYGKQYVYKQFLKKNAYKKKTKAKVFLVTLSPRIYCMVNRLTKL